MHYFHFAIDAYDFADDDESASPAFLARHFDTHSLLC